MCYASNYKLCKECVIVIISRWAVTGFRKSRAINVTPKSLPYRTYSSSNFCHPCYIIFNNHTKIQFLTSQISAFNSIIMIGFSVHENAKCYENLNAQILCPITDTFYFVACNILKANS